MENPYIEGAATLPPSFLTYPEREWIESIDANKIAEEVKADMLAPKATEDWFFDLDDELWESKIRAKDYFNPTWEPAISKHREIWDCHALFSDGSCDVHEKLHTYPRRLLNRLLDEYVNLQVPLLFKAADLALSLMKSKSSGTGTTKAAPLNYCNVLDTDIDELIRLWEESEERRQQEYEDYIVDEEAFKSLQYDDHLFERAKRAGMFSATFGEFCFRRVGPDTPLEHWLNRYFNNMAENHCHGKRVPLDFAQDEWRKRNATEYQQWLEKQAAFVSLIYARSDRSPDYRMDDMTEDVTEPKSEQPTSSQPSSNHPKSEKSKNKSKSEKSKSNQQKSSKDRTTASFPSFECPEYELSRPTPPNPPENASELAHQLIDLTVSNLSKKLAIFVRDKTIAGADDGYIQAMKLKNFHEQRMRERRAKGILTKREERLLAESRAKGEAAKRAKEAVFERIKVLEDSIKQKRKEEVEKSKAELAIKKLLILALEELCPAEHTLDGVDRTLKGIQAALTHWEVARHDRRLCGQSGGMSVHN